MALAVVDARRTAVVGGDATAEYRGPCGPLTGLRRQRDTAATDGTTQVIIDWGRQSAKDPAAVLALRRGLPMRGLEAVVSRPGTGLGRTARQVHVVAGARRWTWHERGRLLFARTRFEREDGSVVAEVRFGNRLAVDGDADAVEVRLAVVCWIGWIDTLAQPIDLVAPI